MSTPILDEALSDARRGWTFEDGSVRVDRAAKALADAVERVRALHYRTIGLDGYTGMCAHCFHTRWPCETVRALEGPPR